MLQASDGLGFARGSAPATSAPACRAGQDHLEGDEALEADLPGLVDDPHAAAAEDLQDLVARHGGPGGALWAAGPALRIVDAAGLGVSTSGGGMWTTAVVPPGSSDVTGSGFGVAAASFGSFWSGCDGSMVWSR